MANPYVIDFSAPTNALARYAQQGMQGRKMEQQQSQFEAQNALARAGMAQSDRHFQASNALAQRTADRADALAPGQIDLQKANIANAWANVANARAQGATAAQLAPHILEIKRNEAILAKAKAEGKDAETMMMRDILGGGQPASPAAQQPMMPGVRPQSFNGGQQQPMMPTPVVDAGQPAMNALAPQQADPNLILTQGAPVAPQPQAQASPADIMKGMTPAQRAQFGMAWMGKGEASKVFGAAADADKLSKEARNKIDEQEMKAVNAVGRLKSIAAGYKDDWLTWEGQWKQYGAALFDKSSTLRKKLKPEQVKSLEEFTDFQRNAFENLTQGIQDATGAAMGIQEERRIRRGLPDPEKDSPTQFKAKLMSSMRSLELSIQRTQFLRQNGFKGDANSAEARMPMDRFEKLREESRGLYQKLKTENPNADDGAIRDSVRQTINRKYGINA